MKLEFSNLYNVLKDESLKNQDVSYKKSILCQRLLDLVQKENFDFSE